MQERSYEDSVGQRYSTGNMKLFHAKMKVNTCSLCEIGLFTEEDDGEIEVSAILCTYVIVAVYFAYILSFTCIETPIGHVQWRI